MEKKTKILTFASIIFFILISLTIQEDFSDALFNTGRILSIADNFKMGVRYPFPSYFTLFDNSGYACPLFYGDLFLIPPALIYLLTNNLSISVYLYCIALFIGCYFSAFYVLKKMVSDNEFKCAIFALIYALSPYFVVRVIIALSFSGALAMIFTPLCIYGFYECVYKDELSYKSILKLTIPMFCLLLSHLISTVLMIAYMLVWFIVRAVKKKIRKNNFCNLVIAAILFLLTTCYFWLPMFEQMAHYSLKVFASESNTLLSVTFSEYYRTFIEYFTEDTFVRGPYLLVIPITIVIARILLLKNEKIKKYDFMFILMVIAWIIQGTPFILKIIEPYAGVIQSPHRINVILNFVEVIYLFLISEEVHPKFDVCLMGLQVFAVLLYIIISFGEILDNSYFYEKYTRAFVNNQKEQLCYTQCLERGYSLVHGMGEYLPENFNARYFALTDFEEKYNYKISRDGADVYIETEKEGIIELPVTYQYGYKAIYSSVSFNNDKGVFEIGNGELDIELSDNGLIQLDTKEGSFITLTYERTKMQIISIFISLISILGTGICGLFQKKKESNT